MPPQPVSSFPGNSFDQSFYNQTLFYLPGWTGPGCLVLSSPTFECGAVDD